MQMETALFEEIKNFEISFDSNHKFSTKLDMQMNIVCERIMAIVMENDKNGVFYMPKKCLLSSKDIKYLCSAYIIMRKLASCNKKVFDMQPYKNIELMLYKMGHKISYSSYNIRNKISDEIYESVRKKCCTILRHDHHDIRSSLYNILRHFMCNVIYVGKLTSCSNHIN